MRSPTPTKMVAGNSNSLFTKLYVNRRHPRQINTMICSGGMRIFRCDLFSIRVITGQGMGRDGVPCLALQVCWGVTAGEGFSTVGFTGAGGGCGFAPRGSGGGGWGRVVAGFATVASSSTYQTGKHSIFQATCPTSQTFHYGPNNFSRTRTTGASSGPFSVHQPCACVLCGGQGSPQVDVKLKVSTWSSTRFLSDTPFTWEVPCGGGGGLRPWFERRERGAHARGRSGQRHVVGPRFPTFSNRWPKFLPASEHVTSTP